jgi:hypothetical protein
MPRNTNDSISSQLAILRREMAFHKHRALATAG